MLSAAIAFVNFAPRSKSVDFTSKHFVCMCESCRQMRRKAGATHKRPDSPRRSIGLRHCHRCKPPLGSIRGRLDLLGTCGSNQVPDLTFAGLRPRCLLNRPLSSSTIGPKESTPNGVRRTWEGARVKEAVGCVLFAPVVPSEPEDVH